MFRNLKEDQFDRNYLKHILDLLFCADWGELGGGFLGGGAVCILQIRRQDKRQYWRFNACFAFGVCGCCNLLGKNTGLLALFTTLWGDRWGVNRFGNRSPASTHLPTHPNVCSANESENRIVQVEKKLKRATMGIKRVEKPAGN